MSKTRRIADLIEFVGVVGMLVAGGYTFLDVSVSSLVIGPLSMILNTLVFSAKSPVFLAFLFLVIAGEYLKEREEKQAQADLKPVYDLAPAQDEEQEWLVAAPACRATRLRGAFEQIMGGASFCLGLTILAATLWLLSGGTLLDFGRIVVIAAISGVVMLIGWCGSRWAER